MNISNGLSLAALTVAVFLHSACSRNSSDATEWDGSIADSSGVELVRNGGTPLWGESNRWILSEVLKIGVQEGDPNYMFGRLTGGAVLSDGSIVVADGMAQQLRFFRPDGHWEKTVGRAGAGPGEFGSRGLDVLVGPDDTLLVLDWEHQRANRMAPQGTWLDSWGFGVEDGWMVRAWDDAATGRIVTHMARMPGMEAGESDTLDFVVVRDLTGEKGDTVGTVPASRTRRVTGERMRFYLYAGEPQASLCSDNSVVTGRGDRYEIKRYDPSGNLEQVVTLGRPNTPITQGDRTFLSERFKQIYLENGFTPERVEELLGAMHFTETYPAFVTLQCGPRGSIWVQPARPVSALSEEEREEFWVGPDAEAAAHFDVFDRQGRYLGVIPLPAGFWPKGRFRGDHLFGRWTDSLGVEYVKVLEVDGLPPSE